MTRELLKDDARLQLPEDNIFRYGSNEPPPTIPEGASQPFSAALRTAAEIEAARKARKLARK